MELSSRMQARVSICLVATTETAGWMICGRYVVAIILRISLPYEQARNLKIVEYPIRLPDSPLNLLKSSISKAMNGHVSKNHRILVQLMKQIWLLVITMVILWIEFQALEGRSQLVDLVMSVSSMIINWYYLAASTVAGGSMICTCLILIPNLGKKSRAGTACYRRWGLALHGQRMIRTYTFKVDM